MTADLIPFASTVARDTPAHGDPHSAALGGAGVAAVDVARSAQSMSDDERAAARFVNQARADAKRNSGGVKANARRLERRMGAVLVAAGMRLIAEARE